MSLQFLIDGYQEESRIERMVSRQPPTTTQITQLSDRDWAYNIEEEPADGSGMNLSGGVVGLIGGIIEQHDSTTCAECIANPLLAGQQTSYPPRFPVRQALTAWERYCRRHHRQVAGRSPMHRDHVRGPVCAQLLWMLIREQTGLAWAAEELGISYARAERLQVIGVNWTTRFVLRLANKRSQRVG